MSAELEMLNEENGRLRRHIATLDAHCTKVESELAAYQAVVLPVNVYEALKRITKLEQALDVVLEVLNSCRGVIEKEEEERRIAIAKLKEVRRD